MAAAKEAFLDKGFSGATVRDICRRAEANVAAVNYYFGDKNGVYLAVLDEIFSESFSNHPMQQGTANNSLEQQLENYVRVFLERIFHENDDQDRDDRECRLIAQAITTPSPVLDMLVERYISPMSERLRSIISRLLGLSEDHSDVWLCAKSVAGQCMHYLYGQAVMHSLDPKEIEDQNINTIVNHIVRFSLAGVQQRREEIRS